MCKHLFSYEIFYCIFCFEAGKLSCVQVLGLWKTKLSTSRRKDKEQTLEEGAHDKRTIFA